MQNWRELIEFAFGKLEDNWVKIVSAMVLTAIGWAVGYWRARRNWAKREFLDRLNVSLNAIEGGTLRIRTLAEVEAEVVFLNREATRRVVAAASRTTAADPILPLPKEDYWYYLNAVLNEVSERFAAGTLRRDLGGEVRTATYLLCLTCEAAGAARTRKLRAMLIRKDRLTALPADRPALEAEIHAVRWNTLHVLAAEYAKNPWRFIEIELCG